ncbi:MAG: InlB B-repeat-containing protein, partial [Kiritimatiellae bacterium]|nr:InlB B-repeat-containing protein [Kiritimatiellia bacterium]
GTGTMAVMEGRVWGDKKALPANAFTRKGYVFSGWAKSATGAKEFEDESTYNITSKNGVTFTIYAVWQNENSITANDEAAEEETTAIAVNPLPSWVVGTFYGICYADDWPNGIEIKVAASGAVTATIVDVDAPLRVAVEATNVYRDGENFCFDFSQSQANGDHSSGHVIIAKSLIDEAAQTPLGYLSGTEEGEDEDGDPYNYEWTAYQDAYVAKPAGVVLPTFAASDSTLQIPVNEPLDGTLTLKFGANGVVAPAWSGDGKFAMFAAHMTPVLVTDDFVHAYVWVMGYDKAADEAIGSNIYLLIPVSANGTAKASDVDADIEYVVFGD